MCRHSLVGAVLLHVLLCIVVSFNVYLSEYSERDDVVIYGFAGLFFAMSGVYVLRFKDTYELIKD